MDPPPIIRRRPEACSPLPPEFAYEAIKTVEEALSFMSFGPPIIHEGPGGELHIDFPLMYQGYGIDRVHFDPKAMNPSPKGRPVHCHIEGGIDIRKVEEAMNKVVKELRVIDAAEFRGPEDCWAVPLAWKNLIIAHVKVSRDGKEIVPDYPLTEEVRRHVY